MAERTALAPMSQQWDGLSEEQQRSLLGVAKYFPDLTVTEKQRFLSRLESWGKLSPAQRQAARDKYRAFSKVSEDTQEQVRQMVKDEQANK